MGARGTHRHREFRSTTKAAPKVAHFTAFDNPGVAALQNPEAAKLLAQMQAPAFSAEMDLQVGDLPWAGFKNRPG